MARVAAGESSESAGGHAADGVEQDLRFDALAEVAAGSGPEGVDG